MDPSLFALDTCGHTCPSWWILLNFLQLIRQMDSLVNGCVYRWIYLDGPMWTRLMIWPILPAPVSPSLKIFTFPVLSTHHWWQMNKRVLLFQYYSQLEIKLNEVKNLWTSYFKITKKNIFKPGLHLQKMRSPQNYNKPMIYALIYDRY